MEEKKSRIIIKDLPSDEKVSREQMIRILGGVVYPRFKMPEPGEPVPWPSPWPKSPIVYW